MLISPWKGAQVKPDASLSQDGYVQSLKIDTKFENEFGKLISRICRGCSPKH
jgi:hypothetical protein